MQLSQFALTVSSIALGEFEKFHLLREQDPALSAQIRKYWEELGLTFPGVQTAWSAVFVSWCVKSAGAKATEFNFSSQHSVFVYSAIKNRELGQGVFHGWPVPDYTPKVGDIVHNNRSGHSYNFEFARSHADYESHSAIVVEVGQDTQGSYLRTVGGNESDSVGMKEVRLDATGRIKNSSGIYISLIENKK